jgi:hypothetical protein
MLASNHGVWLLVGGTAGEGTADSGDDKGKAGVECQGPLRAAARQAFRDPVRGDKLSVQLGGGVNIGFRIAHCYIPSLLNYY